MPLRAAIPLVLAALLPPAVAVSAPAAPVAPVAPDAPDAPARPSATFTNPLLDSGPDPWIARDGDTYYFLGTRGDRIAIRRTRDLGRLADAPEATVWTAPKSGPNAKAIWAPELHRIDGSWFLYYSATDAVHDDDAHRGVFVLENRGDDPLAGEWIDRGRLATARPGIDGTTFVDGGRRWFAYSPYVGPDSVIAIVEMANPWTLRGEETVIARPDNAWERQGGRQILEGPQFLRGPKGDVFLTYSGSACWSDGYAIGLLRAKGGSDLRQAASWTKADRPILAMDADRGVFAPGHNGFFETPDGRETWIVYHANPRAGMGCTKARAPRMQRVQWTDEGRPTFDRAPSPGTPERAPGR